MNNWCICWFSRIFLLGILIFKGLTARRLYKSLGVKRLMLADYRLAFKNNVIASYGSSFGLKYHSYLLLNETSNVRTCMSLKLRRVRVTIVAVENNRYCIF
jgi:hypothetical protein